MDLLCVGLTTLDILGRPIDAIPADESGHLVDEIEIVPAGTAGGTALVAARLGLRVGLLSALGDDNPGRFVRACLTDAGIDLALCPTLAGQRTSCTILPIDRAGRRPTFHALGASMHTQIGPLAYESLAGTKFIHYAGIGAPHLDQGAGAAFLRAARQAGCTITCDLIAPSARTRAEVQSLLPQLDYFLPSLAEASFLTGEVQGPSAARALRAMGAAACAVKCGADGVWLAVADDLAHVPAYDVTVADTTSCGDSWCAGFIAALARGWSAKQAASFAAATASQVAQGLGTLGKLMDFPSTETAMRTLRPK